MSTVICHDTPATHRTHSLPESFWESFVEHHWEQQPCKLSQLFHPTATPRPALRFLTGVYSHESRFGRTQ
jgi:hypothetical protein